MLPIAQLKQLETVQGAQWVSSQRAITSSSGFARNAGDAAMFSDVVKKQQDVDGAGVTIGVMSDSYNCLAGAEDDVLSGDLPDDVQVIKEYSFCEDEKAIDEGRAMIQLIHDIAPGAKILFHTAIESPVDFAQGIITLADRGANIIVDDIGWLLMPMVQEGPITQAVNEVEQRGVVYFSAAGNSARLSYQQVFKKTEAASGALAHDFGLAAGQASDVYQKITLPKDVSVRIVLQWDDPASIAGGKGAKTDLDLFVFDSENNRVIASSQDNNIGHDPVEIIAIEAVEEGISEANLFIRKSAGRDPLYVKYVMFSSGGVTELIKDKEVLIAEQLHFNEDDALVGTDGELIKEGISVVVTPGYSGEFSIYTDFFQIGAGGAPIVNQSNGQHGILLNNTYYPIDRPIWFIPDGFSARLTGDNKVALVDDSLEPDVQTDIRIAEYDTRSSTIYGHSNAAGAIAVGAMSYRQSPWFNGNAQVEKYSSAGGLPILFDTTGEPLEQAIIRAKPEIVAIDDIDTTFFPVISEETDSDGNDLPNFRGTSAAAPNAAAVAALLLQKYAYLKPKQVREIMMQGTVDLKDPVTALGEFVLADNPCAKGIEFDWGTGCGLIKTDLIFKAAEAFSLNSGLGDFNEDGCVDEKDTDVLGAILRSDSDVQKKYDLTGDGKITDRDFEALLSLYGSGCSG
ncbi:MAG: S8 family serine peptidase [Methyloprofundus sp.]|nr:S8 family serine peptidase [Methyloprofundus sp.]